MTRTKRPLLAIIISCLLLTGVGLIVWLIPPNHWWKEVATFILLSISLWLGLGWGIGQRKISTLLTIFLLGTLFMNRLGILSWITLGLWVGVIGLINLIN